MADLLQFLKGTSARPRVTFYSDGVPVDLDSGVPVVTITKPDLTTIASGTVSHVGIAGTGTYEFTLAAQPEVTLLTITWAGPIGGLTQQITTYVEVVGGFLFTMAELRAMKVAGSTPFSSSVAYPDATLLDTRAEILEEFTDILGFSPVPRYAREVHSVGYGGEVLLDRLLPLRVISVTVAGTASPIAGYYLDGTRLLPVTGYLPGYWSSTGYGNVVVEYAHGTERVKGDGRGVALLRAAMKLNPSVSSTVNSMSTPDGATYSWDRAGTRNAAREKVYYGVGAIAEWLNEHQMVRPGVA